MVRHWPPKLLVLMTLAFFFPDTTSNLQKMLQSVLKHMAKTVFMAKTHTLCVCVHRLVAYPNPKSSMFGGRVDFVHTGNLSWGQCSSRPSSSQSWSPLHTRDWLMHFPDDRHIHKTLLTTVVTQMCSSDRILTRSTTKPVSASILQGAAFSCLAGPGFSPLSLAAVASKLSKDNYCSASSLQHAKINKYIKSSLTVFLILSW